MKSEIEFYRNIMLLNNSLFKSLTRDNINYIFNNSIVRKYNKGDLILNKNNSTHSLYILLKGIVQIGYLSRAGRFHSFIYYSEQNAINLVPCLGKNAFEYDYYAFNQVSILVVPTEIFVHEMNQNNTLRDEVFNLISFRMNYLMNEIKFLNIATLHQKICKSLLALAKHYGIECEEGLEVSLRLSQHDLADLLSTSRQTVNKEIKNMTKKNIISWQYESIIIKDLFYLNIQVDNI